MKDDEAVRVYLEMLEENPEDISTRFSLACALFRSGHAGSAREQFEKIQGRFPESIEARLSRDWIERIYRLKDPESRKVDVSALTLLPLSVYDIVSRKTTHLARENYCFFHTDKEKKFSCSVCGRALCSLCASLRKGKVLCPECIAKGAAESKKKSKQKLPPVMRGIYSGIIVSVFLSLFTAGFHTFGVGMVFIGFAAAAPPGSVSYSVVYLVHLAHFSVLCALSGAMSQHYEKLTFFKCAEFCGRVGIGSAILFSIVTGAETLPEFVVPLFQFWFLLLISGFFISFVNNSWFLPMDEVKVRT